LQCDGAAYGGVKGEGRVLGGLLDEFMLRMNLLISVSYLN